MIKNYGQWQTSTDPNKEKPFSLYIKANNNLNTLNGFSTEFNNNNNFNNFFTNDDFISVNQEPMINNIPYFTRSVSAMTNSITVNPSEITEPINYNIYTQQDKDIKYKEEWSNNYNVTFKSRYKNYYFYLPDSYILAKSFSLVMTENSSSVKKRNDFEATKIDLTQNIMNLLNTTTTNVTFTINDYKFKAANANLRTLSKIDWANMSKDDYETNGQEDPDNWKTSNSVVIPGPSNKAKFMRYYKVGKRFAQARTTQMIYASTSMNYRLYNLINLLYKGTIITVEESSSKYKIIPGKLNTNGLYVYLKKANDDTFNDYSFLNTDTYITVNYNKAAQGVKYYYLNNNEYEEIDNFPTTTSTGFTTSKGIEFTFTTNSLTWSPIIYEHIDNDVEKLQDQQNIEWYQVLYSNSKIVNTDTGTNTKTGLIKNNITLNLSFKKLRGPYSAASMSVALHPYIVLDAIYQNKTLYYVFTSANKTTLYQYTPSEALSYITNNTIPKGTTSLSEATDNNIEEFIKLNFLLQEYYWSGDKDEIFAADNKYNFINLYKDITTLNNDADESAPSTYDLGIIPTVETDVLIYEYNKDDFIIAKQKDNNKINLAYTIQAEQGDKILYIDNDYPLIAENLNNTNQQWQQSSYLYIFSKDTAYPLNNNQLSYYLNNNNYDIYLSTNDYTAKDSIKLEDKQNDKYTILQAKIRAEEIEDYFEYSGTTYKLKFESLLMDNNIVDSKIHWQKYVEQNNKNYPLYDSTKQPIYDDTTISNIEENKLSQYFALTLGNINQTLYQDSKINIITGRHTFLENYARRLSYIESFNEYNPYIESEKLYTIDKQGRLFEHNNDTIIEKTIPGTFSINNPFGDIGKLVKINGYDNEGNLVDPSVSGIITINDDADAWRKPIINNMGNNIVIAPETENGNLYASIVTKGGIAAAKTIKGERLYGAVWNDYAEYRQTPNVAPGRCVIEQGDGTLHQSTERLQPGASIVSDTYGFGVGETALAKTPIAVSGRVLAYPYEDRNSYKPGAAVCSGPNGTISMMTREEIREWPDCIVGTVSEIPQYEKWGTDAVSVDGRIWIKIK